MNLNIEKSLIKLSILCKKENNLETNKSILFITKFPPVIGGTATQEYWYAYSLAKQGYKIYVVTNCNEDELGFYNNTNFNDLYNNCNKKIGTGFIKTYFVSEAKNLEDKIKRSHIHYPYNDMSFTKMHSISQTIIENYKPNYIYSGYIEPYALISYFLSKEYGLPHIMSFAGSDITRLMDIVDISISYKKVFSNVSIVMTRWENIDRLIFLGFSPNSISLMPKPVIFPSEYYKEDKKSVEFKSSVGIFGKFGKHKKIETILNAINKFPSIKLNCLYFKGNERYIKALIAENNITNVCYYKALFPWNMRQFLLKNDLMFFFDEKFDVSIHSPLAAIEAALCGVCIIMSKTLFHKLKFNGLRNNYNCIVINKITVEEINKILMDYLLNPLKYKNIGNNATRLSIETCRNIKFPSPYIKGDTKRFNELLIIAYSFFKYSISILGEAEIVSYLNKYSNEISTAFEAIHQICDLLINELDNSNNNLDHVSTEIIKTEILKNQLLLQQLSLNQSLLKQPLFEYHKGLDHTFKICLTVTIVKKLLFKEAFKILYNGTEFSRPNEINSKKQYYIVCKKNYEFLMIDDEKYGEFLLSVHNQSATNFAKNKYFFKALKDDFIKIRKDNEI